MAASTFSTFLVPGRDSEELARHQREKNSIKKIARSAIKWIDIQAAPEKVYGFLLDPLNWPQYAIVNLRSVSPGENGWFKAVTKFGEGELKINGVKELGVFDHVWKDPQATWQVYSRVVPNGDGSTVMMTLFQPPVMSDPQFDQAMKEMDIEMNKLKEIMTTRGQCELLGDGFDRPQKQFQQDRGAAPSTTRISNAHVSARARCSLPRQF